ncbi:hypothetical protein CPC08DRAFT_755030 [Agrocybe pediades]|nr:hypothetical protein CPC08DRAFT_755030 [Agrocybe pediades]
MSRLKDGTWKGWSDVPIMPIPLMRPSCRLDATLYLSCRPLSVNIRGPVPIQIPTPTRVVWRYATASAWTSSPIQCRPSPFGRVLSSWILTSSFLGCWGGSPSPVEKSVAEHPSVLAFSQTQKPAPTSFAKEKYLGVTAFKLVDAGTRLCLELGVETLSEEEKAKLGPNYLFDEIAARVAEGPFSFRLLAQIAEQDDVTDDATVLLPETRKVKTSDASFGDESCAVGVKSERSRTSTSSLCRFILSFHRIINHAGPQYAQRNLLNDHYGCPIDYSYRLWSEAASKDDPYIAIAERALAPLAAASVPGQREVSTSFVYESLAQAQGNNAAARGNIIDEQSVKEIAGAMYAGVADSVLRKAQRELDDVLGSSRFPEFSDMDSLPYCTAVVKETLRWRPVAPLNFPRQVPVDDEYRGYRVAAGPIVIQNACYAHVLHKTILHDENVYPDPLSFKPERFIKDGKWDASVGDPLKVCFGAGRRQSRLDERGNVIEPDREFASSLVCMPNYIVCTIEPRSKDAEALVRASTAWVQRPIECRIVSATFGSGWVGLEELLSNQFVKVAMRNMERQVGTSF